MKQIKPPNQPPSAREILLEQARAIVTRDRNTTYGPPEQSFANIAMYWNEYLRQTKQHYAGITSQDVAQMMILLKLARLANNPAHFDSLVDVAGYAACAAECQQPAQVAGSSTPVQTTS